MKKMTNAMSKKVPINLRSVQETLLLPLWGRAVETRKRKPLLVDTTAMEIIDTIDYDFTTIATNISLITQLAWIARSLHVDRVVREFLERHPRGTIVNIGCGLDTTFERVDNGSLLWYDLDLPDVIALRRQFVADGKRRRHIASSFLDDAWFAKVKVEDSILFIAAGVFYYFEENQMKYFLSRLAGLFPGGEAFFDAASPLGMRTANKVVIQAGGMDQNSFLKWGIQSAYDIQSWDSRIRVVEEFPMFRGIKRRVSFKEKIGTWMSDVLKIMFMIRLVFQK
jgi:O-methyltransferase involved in polyketide biosynthesis